MPEIDTPTYQQLFEFPVEAYYRKLGFDFSIEPFDQLASQYIEIYNSQVSRCKLHLGAITVIDRLAKLGIPQFLLSSLEHSSLVSEAKHHMVCGYLKSIRGLDDHYAAGKIVVGRALIQELEIEPSRTVLIGDTVHDLEVATELGVACILISDGHYW